MKLYHYTTIEAFRGIIENSELWLSERNCMNDVYDENYIKDIVKNILNPNASPLFTGSFLDRGFISDKPQYVFSTSIDKDAAHQWLSYGNKNPICIEFDKEKLSDYFTEYSKLEYNEGIHIYKDDYFSSPVVYNADEVVKKAKLFISMYKDELLKEFDNLTSAPSDQYKTAKMEFHKFYSCVKQNNFYAENEYRFLIYSKKKPSFRTKGNTLVSYLNVHIEKTKLPISGIIISPYTDDESYKNTLHKFLEKYRYDNVALFSSELRLRR